MSDMFSGIWKGIGQLAQTKGRTGEAWYGGISGAGKGIADALARQKQRLHESSMQQAGFNQQTKMFGLESQFTAAQASLDRAHERAQLDKQLWAQSRENKFSRDQAQEQFDAEMQLKSELERRRLDLQQAGLDQENNQFLMNLEFQIGEAERRAQQWAAEYGLDWERFEEGKRATGVAEAQGWERIENERQALQLRLDEMGYGKDAGDAYIAIKEKVMSELSDIFYSDEHPYGKPLSMLTPEERERVRASFGAILEGNSEYMKYADAVWKIYESFLGPESPPGTEDDNVADPNRTPPITFQYNGATVSWTPNKGPEPGSAGLNNERILGQLVKGYQKRLSDAEEGDYPSQIKTEEQDIYKFILSRLSDLRISSEERSELLGYHADLIDPVGYGIAPNIEAIKQRLLELQSQELPAFTGAGTSGSF